MREELVTCDICGSELKIQDWVHLPFRKSFMSYQLTTRFDLCGKTCEDIFWTYYHYYMGEANCEPC